jgi:integrase
MRHPVRGIAAVRERSGVKEFRLHDVRRTVSQRVAEEFGEGMSHSILGHAQQREGLDWWSTELGRVLAVDTTGATSSHQAGGGAA